MADNSEGSGWNYNPNDVIEEQPSDQADSNLMDPGNANGQPVMARDNDSSGENKIEWTASEFIEHKKPASWYLVLAAVVIVVAVIVYFFSRDYISTGAVVIIGIIFGVIAARKPRSLSYRLDNQGLTTASRLHPYKDFKSFWVTGEGDIASLNLLPLKRFMPVLRVYFDPDDGEQIMSILGNNLPLGEHKLDPIDKFLLKIRF